MINLIPCLRQKSRKHTLANHTSPLSPYKGVPPLGGGAGGGGLVTDFCKLSTVVRFSLKTVSLLIVVLFREAECCAEVGEGRAYNKKIEIIHLLDKHISLLQPLQSPVMAQNVICQLSRIAFFFPVSLIYRK